MDQFLSFMFPVCHALLSVRCSLVVICWERADLLALLYMVFYCVLSLSHLLSWVRYLTVSISGLFLFSCHGVGFKHIIRAVLRSWQKVSEYDLEIPQSLPILV